MIKTLIPHYFIDEERNEANDIAGSIHFSISPYFDELPEVSQKIFNSLLSNEKVYTQIMMQKVSDMLQQVESIISKRLENIDGLMPEHIHNFLNENYTQQLAKINELQKIFTL